MNPARLVRADPSLLVVGATHLMVAVPVPATEFTVIENAARETVAVPSDTEMTMFDVVPVFELVGVPVSAPVAALKEAQVGLFWMLNVSALPSASEAVGVKL